MKRRHGHAINYELTPTYMSWRGMLQRCRAKSGHKYRYYAARGITYCERWESFENFLADMGERPTGTSLDRKDNFGNYTKANCHWATRSEQMCNRRSFKRRLATHCKRGHEFTPENTSIQHGKFRLCKACQHERAARFRLAHPKFNKIVDALPLD